MNAHAYANKDQMKVWKSASKPLNDGYPESPQTKIVLDVRTGEKGMLAMLTATDSYQMMQRNICVGDGFNEGDQPVQIPIPYDAMAAAEKVMHPKDRAYFFDNKIIVMEITEDQDNGEEIERERASVPFIVQMELVQRDNWAKTLETIAANGLPEKVIMIDAKALKRVVDQLKSGDARVYVYFRMSGDEKMMVTAFDDIEDESIRATIMGLKG